MQMIGMSTSGGPAPTTRLHPEPWKCACAATRKRATKWVGRYISGSTAMTNNSELQYAAVGLPGYNLSTGGATTTTTPTEGDRTLVSLRNVTTGN